LFGLLDGEVRVSDGFFHVKTMQVYFPRSTVLYHGRFAFEQDVVFSGDWGQTLLFSLDVRYTLL
jgi:hypothetical protein